MGKERYISLWIALGLLPLLAVNAAPPEKLKVGVAQLTPESTLIANRDKIAGFIREAKKRGCRVVVFPEGALYWPLGTSKGEIDAAVESLRRDADANDIYALIGGPYQRDGKEKPFERLLVVAPDGQIVQTYNKMWHDSRFNDCPGIFEIDGVPCAAAICADRWIRSVEELPVMAGAKILFECSNNYDNEWLPDLGWYWYVPRALRNEVFVVFANSAKEDRGQHSPGHGHSAFIGPDGNILTAAGEESDKLLVADLDLSRATAVQALARRTHPLFKPFWETGVELLAGKKKAGTPSHQPLVSPNVQLKIAAAQMACTRDVSNNLQRIERLVREAKQQSADVVVFPELAVTGVLDDDIGAATHELLESALRQLQQAAKQANIHVVCGLPWPEGGHQQNCAVAIGPDGKLLTRYAQLVVDRPQIFAAGMSTRSMWFEIKGIPCVLSIGGDALWSEISEMAAWRGAQVHFHLAYDRDTSESGRLKRDQLWSNLASFRTFTATVNAASPVGLTNPSEQASGGSAIWDDYHRASSGKAGGYVPHSAVRLAQAKEAQTILYASQTIPKTNPQFAILVEKSNRPMTAWYAAGAAAIYADKSDSRNSGAGAGTTYYPQSEDGKGGWRSLVLANETATADQKALVRERAGLDWNRLNEAWLYSKSFGGPSSVVVVRHGWIAGEWFTDTSKRGIASCTKSLTALAVAKLCEMSAAGKFKKEISFDEPAWKYLPASWSDEDPRRKAILIRHMLTMSSGLDPYDGPYQDLDAYGKVILSREVEAEPGKSWAYASAPVDLLSLVVEDVSGQLLGDFFNEHVAKPIGAALLEFPKFAGHSGGSGGPQGGVRVATRDLARLGFLLLHDGQWRDESGERRIFAPETVHRVTRWAQELQSATCRVPQLGSPGKEGAQLDYGYLFWTNRTQVRLGKSVPSDAFYMSGWGKQICCVIPSLDMVIVRLGPKRELNDQTDYYSDFVSRIVSAVIP